MPSSELPTCPCPLCQGGAYHPDRQRHQQLLLVFSRLDESQRRWFVALEAKRLGFGGDRLLSQITGMDEKTSRRGRDEPDASLVDNPPDRIRRPGGGRPPVENKNPAIVPALQAVIEPETAGDPMSAQKWVRSSLRRLSACLSGAGHPASPPTVARLLGQLGYALHVNARRRN